MALSFILYPFRFKMGMISARFCVFKKQGTPNDGANVEIILTIRQKKYIDAF